MRYRCYNLRLNPSTRVIYSSVADFLDEFPRNGMTKPEILIQGGMIYTREAHCPHNTPWKLTLIPVE